MRSLGRFLSGLVTAVVVALAIAIPGALFVGLPDALRSDRVRVDPVSAPAQTRHESPAPHEPVSIPVLTYHDVSDRGGRFTLTPERFAAHLTALRAGGFETVTLEDVARLLDGDGSGLPERPVLLTFDDGAASLYTHVDPLLEAHGASAAAFLITDAVTDEPGSYYLSWDRVRALARTGRWRFGSHTADLHHDAPLPGGGTGPPLVNRLTRSGSLEPFAGWQQRTEADLERSLRTLWLELGEAPLGFSYPFTAATDPTNDERIPPSLHTLVIERFGLAFGGTQGVGDTVTSVSDPGHLPRVAVTAEMSAEDLLDALEAAVPLLPTGELDDLTWSASGVRCEVEAGTVRLRGTGYGRCVVEGDTSLWRDYGVRLDVHGADRDVTAIVALRDGPSGRIEVQLGGGNARIQQLTADGWDVLREFPISPADPLPLTIELNDRALRVAVDGGIPQRVTVDGSLTEGALAFGLVSRTVGAPSFVLHETTAAPAAVTRADADRRGDFPPPIRDEAASARQNRIRS